MEKKSRFEKLIALRMGDEDLRQLEDIAEQERTSISAVIRRFIAEGLEGQEDPKGQKSRKGGER